MKLNGFDKIALTIAILMTAASAWPNRGGTFIYEYYRAQIPTEKLPLAIAGLIIANYGPILLTVLFWRWAKRIRTPWILHLLMLPCALELLALGERLFVSTITDPDLDATMSGPVMPGFLMLIFAAAGYYALLARERSIAKSAN